jgi:hypothetical protein
MMPGDTDDWPGWPDDVPEDRASWLPPPSQEWQNAHGWRDGRPPPNGEDHPQASSYRFRLTAFADVELDRTPAYLVRDIIPRDGIVVVWGAPKCGKSFCTLDVVMHVALGRQYRGHRVTQGGVVYIACEGERGLGARIAAWRQSNPLDADAIPFWLITTRLNLPTENCTLISDVRHQIGVESPAAVVIDTLNRSIGGSESADEDMGAYIRAADAIRETFGCAVIIIHHCGLDATRPRGHTSLLGAADAQIAVKRDASGNVVARVEYLKDGASGAEIASRLRVVNLGLDDDGEEITSCIIEPAEAITSHPTTKVPPPSARRALDLLRNAIADHGEDAPASDHIPRHTKAIPTELWRRYCYEGMVTDADTDAAKRQAFGRAAKALQSAGIIGSWSGWVWLVA